MRRNSLFSDMERLMALHSRFTELEYTDRARRRAREEESYMRNARASGLLGDGRLAEMADFEAADLLNPDGIFLGSFGGRLAFFPGDNPILFYAPTGAGKGRDIIQPTLAHSRGRSLIITDVKDGELAWSTAQHRAERCGQKVIFLNPGNLHGFGNTRIDPLHDIKRKAKARQAIDIPCEQLAHLLLPSNPKAGENAWVRQGAQRYLALTFEALAVLDPDRAYLSGAWGAFNASDEATEKWFKMMTTCGIPSIEGRAATWHSLWANVPKQYEAYRNDNIDALKNYAPGSELANATSANDFDFLSLKHEPATVFLMVESDRLSVYAPWIAMLLYTAIESIASERGPVRTSLLIDEMAQLPASGILLKAIRLYRGKGIQPVIFSQGRNALRERWSMEAVKDMEDQSLLMMKNVSDTGLIRDIELWSGNKTILSRGKNHNGGKIETASHSLGEAKRPVLQSEDILSLGNQWIIKAPAMPHLGILDSVHYDDVAPWKDHILDVRGLHRGY